MPLLLIHFTENSVPRFERYHLISLASSHANDEHVVHTEPWFLTAVLPTRVRAWFIADNAPFPASSSHDLVLDS